MQIPDWTRPDTFDLTELAPWAVTYPSDGRELAGHFFVPEGKGPFPGIVFNHGSAGAIPQARAGIDALTRLGYAVFSAIRRGFNGNPGEKAESAPPLSEGGPVWDRERVELLRRENDDVLAALAWLRQQPQVDPARIAVMGSSFGGVMVVLAAGRTNEVRAGVSFAGPSITWPKSSALQEALLESVRRTEVPLFLIQTQNDHSLAPTYALGAELARLGKPHETRIYPAVGEEPMEGHLFFYHGSALWSADVGRFLDRWVDR